MRLERQLITVIAAALFFYSCSVLPRIVSNAQYEFDQGLALFNSGKYQDAVPRFQRAIELDANFGRAYLYLGRSYVSLRSWGKALPPLRQAYQLAPDETKREVVNILIDALFSFGLDAFRAGDFVSAIDSFKEILGLQPTSAQGKSELVRALVAHGGKLLAQGNASQAISSYMEAVKLAPANFEAIFGLARAFFRNGDYSKALQAAEDATRVSPSNRDLQSFMQDLRKR